MAGGEGTRLRPLTMNQPKPMLPMANRPMVEHIITLLKSHGFDDIILTVSFLAGTLRRYLGDGSEFGVRISYATEESPLGTAGSVYNARDELDDRFLVISGDVLTDVDLSELVAFHERTGAVATLALKAVDNPLEFGIVITGEDGRIERFLEKPTWGQVFSDTINTGIYVLETEVLDAIEPGVATDFSSDVFPSLLAAGRPLYGFITDRYWEDVGTLEAYLVAHRDVLDAKVAVELSGFPLRPGVLVGEGAEIDPSARVSSPAVIGPNCRIGPQAHVGSHCVLGANVRVGEGAELERTVVHDNCYLGAHVTARAGVIGRSCEVREGAHLDDGVVLGDACRIGEQAVIGAGVKIYPNKIVEAGASVNSSIIWESRGTRSLFGRLGVAGLANVDLSPEFAVRVALAWATSIPKGATVTVSRDSSRAARMLKRAAMVGIIAAGLNADDLEAATVPLTRFHVRSGKSQGGITVRLVPGDSQSVVMRFLDADGIDLDEGAQRRVERLYYREEARRVLAAEIGDIDFPARTVESYTAALASHLDVAALRAARFKIVLDYAFGTASFVMPNVLAKLGADTLVINPLVSTVGVLGFERRAHATRVAELVRSSGAHLGAVLGPDGEELTLIDDTGHVLSDEEALLSFVRLVAAAEPGARIAVPVSATWAVNELATDLGAEVSWARIGGPQLMDLAATSDAAFAAGTEGGFAFPRFLPAFDAVASLSHLLALLARAGALLSDVVAGLPSGHVVHAQVSTAFEQKGALMRSLIGHARDGDLILVDGVKTLDVDGWTLVVPDPDLPVTHIYAEGIDATDSARRATQAANDIADSLGRP